MRMTNATLPPRGRKRNAKSAAPQIYQMRTRILSLLLIVAVPYVLSGCGSDANSQNPEDAAEETAPAVPVEAVIATRGSISAFFSGTATLEAEEEAVVVAKAGGIVKELFVEEGTYVEAGDPLAKLDDERLALDMARARVTLDKLRRESDRQREMFDKQLVSAEEYERAQDIFEAGY